MQGIYSVEIIERTRFLTKAERKHKEVLSQLDRLVPRRENAFLFGKNNVTQVTRL